MNKNILALALYFTLIIIFGLASIGFSYHLSKGIKSHQSFVSKIDRLSDLIETEDYTLDKYAFKKYLKTARASDVSNIEAYKSIQKILRNFGYGVLFFSLAGLFYLFQLSKKIKSLTHHSSGTPNGAP